MARQRRRLLLGIDIGGTSLRLALANSPGRVLQRQVLSTPTQETPAVMVETIGRTARDLLQELRGSALAAVGVSVAGPVDIASGQVTTSPHLSSFHQVPLRDMLERELDAPVVLENDANAGAVAEHRRGSGQGVQDMVYVTASTGIGGGVIAGGRLYRGALGGAGEMGHMTIDVNGPACACGRRGCWEAFASGDAIAREAARRLQSEESALSSGGQGPDRELNAQDVYQAALQGDPLSREVLERASFYLGVGLANIVNLLNPELVVLGGGLTKMGERFVAPAFQVCRERVFPLHARGLRLEVTRLGDEVCLMGALVLVQDLLAGG